MSDYKNYKVTLFDDFTGMFSVIIPAVDENMLTDELNEEYSSYFLIKIEELND